MKKWYLSQYRLLSICLLLVLLFSSSIIATAQTTYVFIEDGIRYSYVEGETTVIVTYYDSPNTYAGTISIPSTVNHNEILYTVTGIDSEAFENCTYLRSVDIPTTVTSIGREAFLNTGITSITIPYSVEEIGSSAFSNCESLVTVTLQGNSNEDSDLKMTTSSGNSPFLGSPINRVILNRNLTYDNDNSPFQGFESITSVSLGRNFSTIGNYAFYNCSGITSLSIPDNVTSIGNDAFYGTGIKSITIPNNIEKMGELVFASCTSLTKATINNSVLGSSAFKSCTSLTDVSISSNVTSIENSAFYGCESLITISIPENVTSLGSAIFENCIKLEEAEVLCSMVSDRMFYNCQSLKDISFTEALTSIGSVAFCDCKNLREIIIPKSVTSIGQNAFMNCTLDTMYLFPRLSDYKGLLSGLTSINTIYAHKDQIDLIKDAYDKADNYYPLEDVYTLSIENVYSGSVRLKVTADEMLLIDGVYIKSLTLQAENSLTIQTATLESESSLESIYVAKDLLPDTKYTCTLTYLYENIEYTSEIEVTTSSIMQEDSGITLEDVTTTTATIKITLDEDPYSSPTRYGLAYITDANTTIFYANEEGIVNIEGLNDATEYTLYLYVQCDNTPIITENSITFTTHEFVPPTLQTLEAENITYCSATLKGLVEKGDEEIITKGFEYWQDEAKKEIVSITGDDMSIKIEDLSPTTTYTYCVYASTESGKTYLAEEMTFTTLYDVESAYKELTQEIKDVEDELANVWSEINTNYSDIIDEVKGDYDKISAEIEDVKQKLEDNFKEATIDDDFVEQIRQDLSTISQEIKDLLSLAKQDEIDYHYNKLLDEIEEEETSLEDTWTTIQKDYPNIYELLEPDYTAIKEELTTLSQDLETAYTSGELDDEKAESIENSIKEISQAIENLLSNAKDANADYLYDKVNNKINKTNETLEDAWTTIQKDYPNIYESLEEDYKAIEDELTALSQDLETSYTSGELDDEKAESLESSLDEISQEIEDLLANAKETNVDNIYNALKDEINESNASLEDVWTTIQKDYPNIYESLEDDYADIKEELTILSEDLETSYTSGELDDEKAESLKSSLEEISQEIEDLLTKANEANASYLYDKVKNEINKTNETLEDAWTTIQKDYPNIYESLEDDYKAIEDELTALNEDLETAYTSGELDDEKAESLESSLEEISQEIEDLLTKADDTNTEYLFNRVRDEIKALEDTLSNVWNTIQTDYSSVASEFEDDYKVILTELTALSVEIDDIYTDEYLNKELIETLEHRLEPIYQQINDLLSQADEADLDYLYSKIVDEIKESQDTLSNVWNTIQMDYSSVASEFEDDYRVISTELTTLLQEINDIYDEGLLNRELLETFEGRLESINEEIQGLLSQADEAEFNFLYNKLIDELEDAQDDLEDVWNTIQTDYSDVASEFEDDYKVIQTKLNDLLQEIEDIYDEDLLNKELLETFESRLDETLQEIKDLLSQAEQAHTTGIGIRTMDYGDDVQIFNLNGNRVQTPQKGNVYIFRYANGQTKKVLVK